jgi:hypothetical protein
MIDIVYSMLYDYSSGDQEVWHNMTRCMNLKAPSGGQHWRYWLFTAALFGSLLFAWGSECEPLIANDLAMLASDLSGTAHNSEQGSGLVVRQTFAPRKVLIVLQNGRSKEDTPIPVDGKVLRDPSRSAPYSR